jgi:hypothetical protein
MDADFLKGWNETSGLLMTLNFPFLQLRKSDLYYHDYSFDKELTHKNAQKIL